MSEQTERAEEQRTLAERIEDEAGKLSMGLSDDGTEAEQMVNDLLGIASEVRLLGVKSTPTTSEAA